MQNHNPNPSKHGIVEGNDLWVDGLLCAYEYIHGPKKHIKVAGKLDNKSGLFEGSFDAEVTLKSPEHALLLSPEMLHSTSKPGDDIVVSPHPSFFIEELEGKGSIVEPKTDPTSSVSPKMEGSHWVPIGWARLGELVHSVQIDAQWALSEPLSMSDEYDLSVADLAAPYWEPKAGPTWWCNVLAGHPYVESWLANSQKWLHPAVSEALTDESKLISEKMKHLYYEVGQLFPLFTHLHILAFVLFSATHDSIY